MFDDVTVDWCANVYLKSVALDSISMIEMFQRVFFEMWSDFISQDDENINYWRIIIEFKYTYTFFFSYTTLLWGDCYLYPEESQYNHLMRILCDVMKEQWWVYLIEC